MIQFFNTLWSDVPLVVIDTETTGVKHGYDAAVQVALVRFEKGKFERSVSSFINPRCAIPPQASAIHGIIASDVEGCPTIEDFFDQDNVRDILNGAQPAAYNAEFDRAFVPASAFDDWTWPWVDPLVFVKHVDRFAKGKGRHTLLNACLRHEVNLNGAHSALHDARAAGELFYKIVPKLWAGEQLDGTMGHLLKRQREFEAEQWHNFMSWKASQSNAV